MASAPPLLPQPEDQYQPIQVPQGGLLASTVGTPQEPLPPVDPATAYNQPTNNITPDVYENDDVVAQLNRITSQDSDYMKQARTQGLMTANKRGLLNSSIAAGAAQGAAIERAAPLAAQNAQQMAQRNLERLSSKFAGERQQAQFGHEIGMQERQLTAAEQQQLKDIEARMTMQGIDIQSQKDLQTKALAHATDLANMQIAAEMERLGRQLTAQEEQQIRQLASSEMIARLEIGSREGMNAADLANRLEIANLGEAGATARANLDAATRLQMQELENLSVQQRAALDYYLQSNQIYAQSLASLYANENMPAPARDAAMQNFLALRNSGANLPALIFGENMSWPQGTQPTGGTGGAPGTVALPAPNSTTYPQYNGPGPAEIDALWNNGVSGDGQSAVRAYNAYASQVGKPPYVIPKGETGAGTSPGYTTPPTSTTSTAPPQYGGFVGGLLNQVYY